MTKRRKHFSRADKHSLFLLVTLFWKKKKKFTCFHTWKIILNNPFFFKSFFSCVTSRDKKKINIQERKKISFLFSFTHEKYILSSGKKLWKGFTHEILLKKENHHFFLYAWNQVKEKCLIWFHTLHQPWSLLISWSLALHNNSVGCGNVAADYIRLHLDVMDVR